MEKQDVRDEGVLATVTPFPNTLRDEGLDLKREEAHTLQINVGLLCNQSCNHCHLGAGPHRTEMMDPATIDQVAAFASRGLFRTIDITGGSPEMNPHLIRLLEKVSPLAPRTMVRTNLTALMEGDTDRLIDGFRSNNIVLLASLPSLNGKQMSGQRGSGVLEKSLAALRRLNEAGYGREGTNLELDLVANPTGAFLPVPQEQAEKKYKQDLERKHGIVFNHLYNFVNVPLGRFRSWLRESSNYDAYMELLASSFNPCAVAGLMCRTLVSVSWDGYLYDCDFNLARGLDMGGRKTHVSEMEAPPPPGSTIAVSDHCYACTAGSGFT